MGNFDILNLLVQKKKLTLAQAEDLKKQALALNKSADVLLLEKKILGKEDLVKSKAELFNLTYEYLSDKEILEKTLTIVPSEVAENYHIICFNRDASTIHVGIVDPNNFKAIEAMDFLAKKEGLAVKYFLISDESFQYAFKYYQNMDKEMESAMAIKTKDDLQSMEENKNKTENLEEITRSAPVAKMVSVILRHAIDGHASDIHIEPLVKESRVRYRIDGILHTSLILPRNIHSAIVARIKVMANLKLDETRIPQDGRIRLVVTEKEVDLRVSVMPLAGSEKVVIRILDVTKGVPTLEELGYGGKQLEIIKKNTLMTEGMFLVTGPTGSGKSTTIFSVINMVNKEGVNICTLEDPVEYQIKGVNQSQVKPEIGYTFASGLRSLLRQDPNVIMVGEIRDMETAELAVHAALTGHYVLSTLHTSSAFGAIARLMDMNIEPFLLGSTLNTVVAQRLCRKICDSCKTEVKLPDDVIESINSEMTSLPLEYLQSIVAGYNPSGMVFFKGKGCTSCGNTGYVGRVAITEVIDVNNAVRDLIIKKNTQLMLEDIIKTQHFITMKQDGIIKMLLGLTTWEEVLRVMQT